MAKVGGWLGSILAVVIGGYALWYLENQSTHTPPPPPTHTQTTFDGMVLSTATITQIPNAVVTIQFSGGGQNQKTYHTVTDEHGSFSFETTDLRDDTDVLLSVSATGYVTAPDWYFPRPLVSENRQDFSLAPVSTPSPGPVAPVPSGPIARRPNFFIPHTFKIPAAALRPPTV